MKFKFLGIEVVVHAKAHRPKWKKRYRKILPSNKRTCFMALRQACNLYHVLPHNLKTGVRYIPYPDVRKIISRTLYEAGLSEPDIHEYLHEYLGERATVYAQVRSAKIMDNKFHKEFQKNLNLMREQFVNNFDPNFKEVI